MSSNSQKPSSTATTKVIAEPAEPQVQDLSNRRLGDPNKVIGWFHPEVGISGYTALDGTIEFYGRVKSLIDPSMIVLDFGAGRAAWLQESPSQFMIDTRMLRGNVARVVGCDVDKAIHDNRGVDEYVVIEIGRPLPFKDQEFDLIVSDYTFEHVSNSDEVASELDRILKPGGWICARTPNKWGYVSLLTRMIKSKSHARVLKKAQPDRKEIDVFPTSFKMNTRRSLRRYFDPQRFEHFTYYYESEPRYFFNSKVIFWMMSTFNRFLPSMFRSNLFIFIRKK